VIRRINERGTENLILRLREDVRARLAHDGVGHAEDLGASAREQRHGQPQIRAALIMQGQFRPLRAKRHFEGRIRCMNCH